MKKTSDITNRNIIGARLRQLRKTLKPKVSLEDLAGRLAARGIILDRSAIGRIENGNRYVLDYELKALADALKTTVLELMSPLPSQKKTATQTNDRKERPLTLGR